VLVVQVIYDDDKAMKNEDNMPLNEFQKAQISDLADGRLRGAAFAEAMALLDGNSQARAAWHGLHVVGDALRNEALTHSTNSEKDVDFLEAFRARVVKELQLAPLSEPSVLVSATPVANESYFNWKWAGGLSAAAAVVVFSWNLAGPAATAPNSAGAQLAQSAVQASPVETQSAAGVMLRNPQLDALIAAHNQVGGSSALQMPSGFLRSATFSTTALGDK
jgi:sigma-E factor negative regulatory protein RseA